MSKFIRQSVTFKAEPHEVYEALMDSRKHAKFTGEKAAISRKVGGKIMAYGGYITGENLELAADKKIVQAWHAREWPEGRVSRVTFRLHPVKGGTRLDFTHSGVPDEHYASIKQGWIDAYWEPLKRLLEKNKQKEERKQNMGDKGKKDKEKGQKQKVSKQSKKEQKQSKKK